MLHLAESAFWEIIHAANILVATAPTRSITPYYQPDIDQNKIAYAMKKIDYLRSMFNFHRINLEKARLHIPDTAPSKN